MVKIDNLDAYRDLCRAIINTAIHDCHTKMYDQVLWFIKGPFFLLYCDLAQVSAYKVKSLIVTKKAIPVTINVYKDNVMVKRAITINEARQYTHVSESIIGRRLIDKRKTSNGFAYRLTYA